METKKLIPFVDIFERENEYLLLAEMPGVSKKTLEIETEKNVLKIKGKADWKVDEKWSKIYQEFHENYEFEREFTLGADVDKDKIRAKIENGVLAIVLPKNEKAKPKKIAIQ